VLRGRRQLVEAAALAAQSFCACASALLKRGGPQRAALAGYYLALQDMLHIKSLGAQPQALRLGFGASLAAGAGASAAAAGFFAATPPPPG